MMAPLRERLCVTECPSNHWFVFSCPTWAQQIMKAVVITNNKQLLPKGK